MAKGVSILDPEKKKKKRKKRLIIVAGILIVVAFGVVKVKSTMKEAEAAMKDLLSDTDEVMTRDLIRSVSATGTFSSGVSSDESVDLANVKVTAVNVSVGDSIKIGDLICSFDTSDIEEDANVTQESLDTAAAQNNLSITAAERQLESAKAAKAENDAAVDRNNASAQKTYNDSQTAVNDANSGLEDAKKKVKSLRETVDTTKKAYENAKKISDKAQKTLESKKADLEKAKTERDSVQQAHEEKAAAEDPAHTEAEVTSCAACVTSYNAAVLAVTNAQTASDVAQADYEAKNAVTVTALSTYTGAQADEEAAKAAVTSAESAVTAAKQQADSAYAAYQSTVATGESSKRTAEENIQSQADSVQNAKLTADSSTLTTEQQLKDYKDQLAQGNLTATQNGVVTAVNVTDGGTYAGGSVVTIQDDSALLIETEIDEYDIADLKEGMKVLIKTDATREEELEGSITSISPIATSNASASLTGTTTTAGTSGATYTVKIALDQQNERLRLGMTAKLSIVIEQKDAVLTVPYNAIQEDENGNTFVTVRKEDGTSEDVNVTVGMESNYYTEVSGDDIKEGMSVVLQSEAGTSLEDLFGGGGMGGF